MGSLEYISDNVIAHGIYPHLCFTELVRFSRSGARYHRIMRRPEVMAYYLSDPKRALDVICRIYHDRDRFNILDIYLWLKAYLNYFEVDEYHPFVRQHDMYRLVVTDKVFPLIDVCLHYQKGLIAAIGNDFRWIFLGHSEPHVLAFLLKHAHHIDHVSMMYNLVRRVRECTGKHRAIFDVIYPYLSGKDVTSIIRWCRKRGLEYFAEALSNQ